jgi:excinuclease ABC subunit C
MHFAEQRNLFSLDLRPECPRQEMDTCLGPCAGHCTRKEYTAQLQAAKAFLDGRDLQPILHLQHQLQHASQHYQYERAAGVRDRLERLQYLHDRLELLREPPLPAQCVYPVNIGGRYVWYLLAEGRVVAATPMPDTSAAGEKCLRRLERTYRCNPGADVEVDRPARQIVAAWFRAHRDERRFILSLEDAQQICRQLLAG